MIIMVHDEFVLHRHGKFPQCAQ